VPDLVGLTIADEPAAWGEIGFAVSRAAFALGGVSVQLVARQRDVHPPLCRRRSRGRANPGP